MYPHSIAINLSYKYNCKLTSVSSTTSPDVEVILNTGGNVNVLTEHSTQSTGDVSTFNDFRRYLG